VKVTAAASGSSLNYFWSATLGDILGSGAEVIYAASPCSAGKNRITCRVESGSQSETKTVDIIVMNKKWLFITFLLLQPLLSGGQCLSSVNPVGGTDNLLVIEKQSLRIISFYRYGQGNRYFEGTNIQHITSSTKLITTIYQQLLDTD
jgi:hypothetical protein